MTKEAISHYTMQLLLTQKRAFLPTLGMLYLEPVGAKLNKTMGIISPPSYEVHFAPSDRIGKEELKSQLLQWAQMTETGAERIAAELTEQLRDSLIEGDVSLDKIGVLTNTADGISFEKDPEINEILSPLPEMSISMVEATVEEKAEAAVTAHVTQAKTGAEIAAAHKAAEQLKEKKSVETPVVPLAEEDDDKKGAYIWYIILAAILVLIVGLLSYLFLFKGEKGSQVIADTEITTEIGTEREDMAVLPVEEESQDFVEEDLENSQGAEIGTEDSDVENELYDNGNSGQELGTESPAAKQLEKKSEPVVEPKITEPTVVETKQSFAKADGDCIIVVGAFGSPANLNKMEKKLTDLGWRVYSEKSVTLTRMGVYASCDRSELNAALREIKATVEPAAWIYKEK